MSLAKTRERKSWSRSPKIPKELLRDSEKKPKQVRAIKAVIVDQILQKQILPEGPEFYPIEADHIYVTKRNPLAHSFREPLNPPLAEKDRLLREHSRSGYELDFYERFWDDKEKPVTFLIGHRGCGKSTFLDHFFRSDCFALSTERGPERERNYRLKLRVHLNLRNQEGKTFSDNFWEKAKQSIDRSFENRCSLPDKPAGEDKNDWKLDRHVAFWRRALDLDNPQQIDRFKKLAKLHKTSFEIEVLAASRGLTISNELGVKDALAFFGRHASYFAFLVIVMDNLDQSPVSSQKEAIRIAKNLVRDHALSSL